MIYGNHLLDQSETIAAQMQAHLQAQTCHADVLALAVSSWGPVNQAGALAQSGTFGATSAVLVVSGHDLYDVPGPEATLVPYRLTSPYGAIHDALVAVYERHLRAPPPADTRPLSERAAASYAALESIAARFAAQNIPFHLLYHPSTQERAGQAHPGRDGFASWAAAHGIPLQDLGALTEPELAQTGYRDAIHPNATGAAALARAIADHLQAELNCP